tara:strand:+ start:11010 stop:11309 length:300 start_codon:yes stop_codon:yes gene_type:complete
VIACGEMGLSLDYFYSLTPRQFINIQKGVYKTRESDFEKSLIQTKILSWWVYNTIPEKKGINKKSFPDFSDHFFGSEKKTPADDTISPQEFFKKIDAKK